MNRADQGFRLRLRLLRFWFWLNRFHTLSRAERIFRHAKPRTILGRPLFGYTFFGDVSVGSPQRLLYLEGERFIPEARLILRLLRPGFRALDVGANLGYYCLMLRKGVGASGRIIAIEPSPENLDQLHLNIERNNLSGQIEIIETAVGDRKETVGILAGTNSGVSSGDAAYKVSLDTLDNLIVGRVDFIKMDIEGYEVFALKGARRLLSEYKPTLFIEVHPREIRNLNVSQSSSDVINFLRAIYEHMTVYEQCITGSPFQRILRKYLGIGSFRNVKDIASFVSRADKIDDAIPFWVICRGAL